MNNIIIYDLEVFKNFHSFCGYDPNRNIYHEYYLYDNRRQLVEYFGFLNMLLQNNYTMVGFNNLGYDYPILHNIIRNMNYLSSISNEDILKSIYRLSQNIINKPFSQINDDEVMLSQVDLFRIWHLNNQARRSSLKDIECAMNFHTVQDLPKKFYEKVMPHEINEIMLYNRNDVNATYQFYELSKGKIQLRKDLSKEYDIDLTNADDPKIGSEIFSKIICEEMGIDKYKLSKMRSYASKINLRDVIVPNIKFESSKFNELLEAFKNTTIVNTKGDLNLSFSIGDLTLVYGTGGIHSENKPSIYLSDDENEIIDADITSMYPNIGIRYKKYPKHLSEVFCSIYENVFDKRNLAKKQGNVAVNEGLKLSLNGAFGKSNDKYSFFYDPFYTMSIK